METREISIIEIWQGIRKRLAFILGFGVILGIASALLSIFIIQPKYEANATLIVGKPTSYQNTSQNIEYNDILVNQRLVGTYGEIMKSVSVTQRVRDNLELKQSIKELGSMIRVQTMNDTEIISLTVTDSIPERAMDIANETAEIFIEEVSDIMQVENVQILDAAQMPLTPVSPKIIVNTALGVLVGLSLGIILALFREFSDTRIKSIDEYKNSFDIPVIGIIPNK